MVKNPPANIGDAGSIPDLGRFHMPRAIKTESQLLSPRSIESESYNYGSPHALEPVAPQQEKPPQ